LVCFRKYIEYREEKKRNQKEYEAALEEKLEFLKGRRDAVSRRYLSAEERRQILDLLRNLFSFSLVARSSSIMCIGGSTKINIYMQPCTRSIILGLRPWLL